MPVLQTSRSRTTKRPVRARSWRDRVWKRLVADLNKSDVLLEHRGFAWDLQGDVLRARPRGPSFGVIDHTHDVASARCLLSVPPFDSATSCGRTDLCHPLPAVGLPREQALRDASPWLRDLKVETVEPLLGRQIFLQEQTPLDDVPYGYLRMAVALRARTPQGFVVACKGNLVGKADGLTNRDVFCIGRGKSLEVALDAAQVNWEELRVSKD